MTQEELKCILNYDADAGVFTWVENRGTRAKKGEVAGYIDGGYLKIRFNKRNYKAHHLAFLFMLGYIPKAVDHKDRDKSNCAFSNLRDVSQSENMKNMPQRKDNKSGRTGVYESKHNTFVAHIRVDTKRINLGSYKTFEEAVVAREKAETLYGFHKNHGKKDIQWQEEKQ